MIYSYCAAIIIICISLSADYILPNKTRYFNPSFDLQLNYNMPEIDPTTDGYQLTAWVKTHLGSLYHDESTTGQSAFKTTFNSTFSENVNIYLNHERISRDAFESQIQASRSALALPPTIDWKEMLEIPVKSEENNVSAAIGIVAGYFVVTRSMKFKIRAANAQNLSYNSFSARVSHEGGQTRITELFLTFDNRAAPIHLGSIPTRS